MPNRLKAFRYIFLGIILLLIHCHSSVYGQRKVMNLPTYDYSKYHFGFVLALNQMNFTVKVKDNLNKIVFDSLQSPDIFADSLRVLSVNSTPTLGFTIGIISNLRLGKYFDLRFIPSLSFGERFLDYTLLRYRYNESSVVDMKKSITSTYIDLPFHIKYKSKRLNNVRAYVLAGVKYSIDLATTKANKKIETNQKIVRLNRNDVVFEVGVGFDFYNGWFKFGTEIKMSYGTNNLLKREDNIYTGCIDKLNTKIFQLSFTFE